LRSVLTEQELEGALAKLTPDGNIPDDDMGFPDEWTTIIAQKARFVFFGIPLSSKTTVHPPQPRDEIASDFSPKEALMLEKLSNAYRNVLLSAYSGRNANLLTYELHERLDFADMRFPLDRLFEIGANGLMFFQDERGMWWVSDTKIEGDRSQSFSAKQDPGLISRNISWLRTDHYGKTGPRDRPDFNYARIATNNSSALPLTVELAFKAPTDAWEPYFYVKRGQAMLPVQKINSKPVTQVCIACHSDGMGGFSPRPTTLKTEEDFRRVGYRDEVIPELMRFGIAGHHDKRMEECERKIMDKNFH
jgi:hypothetical protein